MTKVPMPEKSAVEELRSIAWQLFQYLSGDLLSAIQSEGGSSISRAEALEVVIDADRIEGELEKKLPGVLPWWESLTYEEKVAVLKPAFRHARYS